MLHALPEYMVNDFFKTASASWPRAKRIGGFFVAPFVAMLFVVSVVYACAPVFHVAPPRAFAGSSWYNPYANLHTAPGRWQLANFHAHSRAWGGLTSGSQSAENVVAAYRKLHYDVIGVSNYSTSPRSRVEGTFPVYEHGLNIFKAHQLVLGTDHVTWLDYPFWQSRNQQQNILTKLRSNAALVAIAHPRVRNAYTPDDLRYLSDYDLLEVLNRYSLPAEDEWDAALSSGHPVWLLADDDSHNVTDVEVTGVNATEVYARTPDTQDIIDALRAGRAYGVHTENGHMPLQLKSLQMRGDTVSVAVSGAVTDLRILGEDGAVRARATGQAAKRGQLSVVAAPSDGYLRVVAQGDSTMLLTNPVIRWDGRELARVEPIIDWPRTIRWRIFWVLAYGSLGWRYAGLRRRRLARLADARLPG